MGSDTDTQLQSINSAMLTPVVRGALGSQSVEVTDWDGEQIHGGTGLIGSIYRLAGSGCDEGLTIPWSLVLKVIRSQRECTDSSDPDYWRREPSVYQSGLLHDLPHGLAAPRCFGITEREGEVWLWLEDVRDDVGPQWPLERYGLTARHFGHWNGTYLAGRPRPSWPWIGREWLCRYMNRSARAVEQLHRERMHPLLRRYLPDDHVDTFTHLWRTRGSYVKILDQLPQTLCHRDVFRRNLFARRRGDGGDETVAIDWSYVSLGAVGEELVPLVLGTLLYGEVELSEGRELDCVVYENYLDGLRDGGWRGDAREVRLGFTAGSIRYLFAGMGLILRMLLDEEQRTRRSRESLADHLCGHRCITFSLLEEASGLMGSSR